MSKILLPRVEGRVLQEGRDDRAPEGAPDAAPRTSIQPKRCARGRRAKPIRHRKRQRKTQGGAGGADATVGPRWSSKTSTAIRGTSTSPAKRSPMCGKSGVWTRRIRSRCGPGPAAYAGMTEAALPRPPRTSRRPSWQGAATPRRAGSEPLHPRSPSMTATDDRLLRQIAIYRRNCSSVRRPERSAPTSSRRGRSSNPISRSSRIGTLTCCASTSRPSRLARRRGCSSTCRRGT